MKLKKLIWFSSYWHYVWTFYLITQNEVLPKDLFDCLAGHACLHHSLRISKYAFMLYNLGNLWASSCGCHNYIFMSFLTCFRLLFVYFGNIIVFYSFWNGQCIASTTVDEHRTHFEKDKALARRFQPVFINEPSEVMLEFFLLWNCQDCCLSS